MRVISDVMGDEMGVTNQKDDHNLRRLYKWRQAPETGVILFPVFWRLIPDHMTFRINSKCFFLTYPQCDLTPDVLGHFLESLGTHTYVLVAQELHEDGHFHAHALAIYLEKKNVRNQDHFDFEGYHPNVQSCRDRTATRTYILKHEPVDDAKYESGIFDDGKRGGATRRAWQAAMEATTEEEVFQRIAEASPRDFVLMYDKVASYAAMKRQNKVTYVPNADDIFFLPEAISHWVSHEFLVRVSHSPSASSGRSHDRSSLLINNRSY